MKISDFFRLLFTVLAAVTIVIAQSPRESSAQAAVSLVISAAQDHVRAGTAVPIKATLTNTSNADIFVIRDRGGRECKIEVRDIKGDLMPDTAAGYMWNGHVPNPDPARVSPEDLKGSLESGTLKPGEKLEWAFNAAKFYEMGQPGKYTIQIRRPDPENPAITLKSNVATVTVVP